MIRVFILCGLVGFFSIFFWNPPKPRQSQAAKIIPIPIFEGEPFSHPYLVEIPGGRGHIGAIESLREEKYRKSRGHNSRTIHMNYKFMMMSTELSAQLAERLIGDKRFAPSSCTGKCPAVRISWYDAIVLANLLSQKTGFEACYITQGETVEWPKGVDCKGYRLPLEEEWEYAAKSGTDTAQFSGGNVALRVSWFVENSTHVQESAQKEANKFGIFDLSGNVWEWCWDGKTKVFDTWDQERVQRGGSWKSSTSDLLLESRFFAEAHGNDDDVGVRFVRSVLR